LLTNFYVIKQQTMCAIVIQWQTIMMLRLNLNDQLVDIDSEGLLRPKLYDEKEKNDFTILNFFLKWKSG
jgi:hypothetical protein